MFNKILIAVDINYIDKAKLAVDTALQLSEHNPDAIFRIVSIVKPMDSLFVSSFLPQNFDKEVLAEANKALHKFTQTHFPPEAKVQHIVAYGTVYEEIINLAEEKNVDLIIMMANSNPEKEGLSGNTVRVARGTNKPILILR